MADELTNEPDGGTLEAAKALQERRFAAVDMSHPAVSALFEAGIPRLAAMMEAEPKQFAAYAQPDKPTELSLTAPAKFIHEIVPPPLPGVFFKLQRVLSDENASDADISKVVATDPGLTGFLLRMVNSAYYSFPSKIDTISRAVTMLGRREIFSQAAAQAASNIYKDLPPSHLINMKRFWRHSLACGLFCRAASLAKRVGDPEQYFVAGLLHDIGRPQLLLAVPDASETAIYSSREANEHQSLSEMRLFGYDHGDVAGMVFHKWNFPEELIHAVSHHHHPERARGNPKAAMAHIADFACVAVGLCVDPRAHVPPFSAEAWTTSGLALAQLSELMAFVEGNLDVFAAMFPAK